jgi:TolA-binding protein
MLNFSQQLNFNAIAIPNAAAIINISAAKQPIPPSSVNLQAIPIAATQSNTPVPSSMSQQTNPQNNINASMEQRLVNLESKMEILMEDLKQIKTYYQDSTDPNITGLNPATNSTEDELFEQGFLNNQEDDNDLNNRGFYNEFTARQGNFEEQNVSGNKSKDQRNKSGFSIEQIYNDSMQQFRLGNYEQAETLLTQITEITDLKTIYPAGPNTTNIENFNEIKANAYLLLAEIFFKKPDYQKSAINFLHAYQNFSKIGKQHVQAGNALLRLSKALYLAGNQNAACQSLFKLSNDFTSVDYSLHQISEAELNKLQCKKN